MLPPMKPRSRQDAMLTILCAGLSFVLVGTMPQMLDLTADALGAVVRARRSLEPGGRLAAPNTKPMRAGSQGFYPI